ncbi:Outer-membrane lipoprotein carrier protein [bioreactor metagenome]|jgi:outer membrane lipoprotein-sorting protein|uniref:Outer-membrane lipoprotein carrier protein n=1 Tax=bioreactor metagenome TaxID=1076179 RepID=A0A644VS54_9ZZZZ|nr:LolA-like putative outer membrane lipoprotein chaperone [Paludibacter sp.]
MQKFIYSIILFINSIFVINAQHNTDAERIIKNLTESFRAQAVRSEFILKISEKNGVNSQQISGTIVLNANRFFLKTDELTVWFDGKTQWAYLENSDEVNITEPTAEELAAINPVTIISAFKSVSRIQFSKLKSQTNHIIELIPTNKKADFSKVEIQLNKTSGNLHAIKIEYKNGLKNDLTFRNYQKNVAVNPRMFIFDNAKYKGAVMNDLR